MDDERVLRFCNGRPPPTRHRRVPMFVCSLLDIDVTRFLDTDEWACVAEFLHIRDRRSFSATSSHNRSVERSAWDAQRVLHLPANLSWNDLWYVALLPLQEIVAGNETLRETSTRVAPRDRRLCVCASARMVARARAEQRTFYLHNVELLRRSTVGVPGLFGGIRNEWQMIASIAAASNHPIVRSFERRHPTFRMSLTLEQLRDTFGSMQTAVWALEALPWPWLWLQVNQLADAGHD